MAWCAGFFVAMTGVLNTVGELSGALSSPFERAVVTVAIVAVVVAVRFLTSWIKRRQGDLSTMGRLLLSIAVGAATVLGALSVLVVWDQGSSLRDAYGAAMVAEQLSSVVLAVVVLATAYAVTDFVGGVIRELSAESTAVSDHQEEVLLRITQLSVYTFSLLVVVGLFTDNVGSLLVGAGFLGIIVGMAARQTLGAVLAGFVLMFSRPFEVGDWVQIGEHEGTVTEISIMSTRLRSFDGEVITIPNDTVRSGAMIDRSRRNRLRIEIEVGIDYDSDIETASRTIESAVRSVDRVAETPEPAVVTKQFADSAVVLGVRYWIRNPSMQKRWQTQTAALNAIKVALDEASITIPFPQQRLSARSGGGLDLGVHIGGDER